MTAEEFESLLEDIAIALQTNLPDGGMYLDLTEQTVMPFSDEVLSRNAMKRIESFPEWEREMVLAAHTHKTVKIEPLDTSEQFRIMESFVESVQDIDKRNKLKRAIYGYRPFAAFRAVVRETCLEEDWYAFKNESYLEEAKRWLHWNGYEFIDGSIQRQID